MNRADVEGGLAKKGFRDTGGKKHRVYKLIVGGFETGVMTMVSRGTKYKTLGDTLVSRMAKQLSLTKAQFVDLVNCPLSHEGFVNILKKQGMDVEEPKSP